MRALVDLCCVVLGMAGMFSALCLIVITLLLLTDMAERKWRERRDDDEEDR